MPSQLDMFEPAHPPFRAQSETSRQAAATIEPHAGTLRARVLNIIRDSGGYGATMNEIERRGRMKIQTVCARVNELEKAGLIKKAGRKRATISGCPAEVYIAAKEFGR